MKNWPYSNPVDPEIYKGRTDWPKISIVTPSYNQGQYIEETILSILNQNYPNLEYIIIDGGSTDHTVEIIKKYEDRITYWVSEKDNGQSHAINKGFEKATGEIFAYLNSDDCYYPNTFWEIANTYVR
ncbi:glycosyltransferase family 2 protein, partial [Pedobacter sp.]